MHTILKFRGWRRNWIGRPLELAGMADEFRWQLNGRVGGWAAPAQVIQILVRRL